MKQKLSGIFKNHPAMMVIGCLIPLAALGALSYMGVVGSWGYYALLLLCPLAHILMMHRGTDDECH